MPVTGMMPMVMPMFSKQLKAKKTKTPMQMMRPIVSFAKSPDAKDPEGDEGEQEEHRTANR